MGCEEEALRLQTPSPPSHRQSRDKCCATKAYFRAAEWPSGVSPRGGPVGSNSQVATASFVSLSGPRRMRWPTDHSVILAPATPDDGASAFGWSSPPLQWYRVPRPTHDMQHTPCTPYSYSPRIYLKPRTSKMSHVSGSQPCRCGDETAAQKITDSPAPTNAAKAGSGGESARCHPPALARSELAPLKSQAHLPLASSRRPRLRFSSSTPKACPPCNQSGASISS